MARCVALMCAFGGATALNTDDSEALVQRYMSTHKTETEVSSLIEKLMLDQNFTLHGLLSLAKEQSRSINNAPTGETVADFAQSSVMAAIGHKAKLAQGWAEFSRLAAGLTNPKPTELLAHAKAALLQTGALSEMREMATKASKTETRGGVPLDSMTVGFYTSLAPWNNVLQEFSLPLIKAQFSLFANFFGVEGNAARVCIGAQMALDSTYGVHSRSEFGGIGVFVGPAKWDNVPGWKFGASGGMDNIALFDVADFAWDWTLAKSPETVGFHFDIAVLDSEGLHASVLQTKAEIESAEQTIPNHGSTYLQHTWCSPDWFNTPLVIVDEEATIPAPSSVTKKDAGGFKEVVRDGEELDLADDAV
mmetsp:Transcript_49600/g.114965  ORF Transcript_49600/g.114965 Transcript_49600/m.114965 type:complete len:363 (-) Transcript_49600:74-1162(-)|eukprot:CAMPEP_0171098594 /NCGR_PEP_ID=MMETSP0766_2-20121228/48803_1 /TAXON_ID=439317 /ORGANISM="Gambierdiscus australes, Strain CAWD 149" /LENGTH=362 /DNA_ID=CAMNT_0011557971 /DNA_START=62 /DNA_END=1150 /DNA_ORIENTATION=-